MAEKEKNRFLFATGSTGGHIFPVIPLALKLKEQGHDVFIVSSGSSLEKEILEKNNLSFFTLQVGRLKKGVGWKERIQTFILLPVSILKSLYLILKLKPQVVMGTGGAVCGPVVLAGALLGRSTFIWELNAVSGLTNKILSYFVEGVFVQFEEAKKYFPQEKCFQFSFPVREGIQKIRDLKREPDGYFHLLILGGSQGSNKINQAVLDMYGREKLETWKIRHQTGKADFHSIQSVYSEDDRIGCQPFFNNIEKSYLWADVVVCRGGASTLAELSACGKAVIVVPLPSSDSHQMKNALSLSKLQAVEILSEENLTGEILFEKIMQINGRKKRMMEENIRKFYDPKSIEKIIHHFNLS